MTRELLSAWREIAALGAHLGAFRWAPLALAALGTLAAFAEMAGVGVAVAFLFALLGQSDALRAGEGPVAAVFHAVERVIGGDVTVIPVALVGVIAVNALLLYAAGGVAGSLLNRIAEHMRDSVHHRYVTLSYRALQGRERGELLHTLATETWTAAEAVDSVARIIVCLSTALVFGAGIFLLSWQIGVTAAVALGALLAVTRALSGPARRVGERTLAANTVLAERMLVSLNGMRTIRVFAQEPFVLKVFAQASSRVRRLAIRREWLQGLVRPMMEIGGVLALVGVVLVAQAARVEGATTVAAGLLLFRLAPRLREMQNHVVVLNGLAASMRNVREILDDPGARTPPDGDAPFPGLRDEARFEGVLFRHEGRTAPVPDRVDLSFRRGEVTALVGPSGSGKTTIVNLLMRLYEPDGGRILVDGAPLASLSRAAWLARVALAGQDVELIEGTIAQNLRLARHDATLADLREACALVEMLEEIDANPRGFDAPIGPGGLSFSGGQRQRLGLARALVRRPEILVLDEALSAVEPALEDRIRERLLAIRPRLTLVSVSHRRDGANWADAVVRIEKGRVVGALRRASPAAAPAEAG